MDIFAVILDEAGVSASSSVKARLREKTKFFYEFSPSVFLVADDKLTENVSKAGGINEKEKEGVATGVVFKVSSYSGYTSGSLWEWLGKVQA